MSPDWRRLVRRRGARGAVFAVVAVDPDRRFEPLIERHTPGDGAAVRLKRRLKEEGFTGVEIASLGAYDEAELQKRIAACIQDFHDRHDRTGGS